MGSIDESLVSPHEIAVRGLQATAQCKKQLVIGPSARKEDLGEEPKVGFGDLLTELRTQLSKISSREIKESVKVAAKHYVARCVKS